MTDFVADLEAASSRFAAAAGAAAVLGSFLGDTREGGAAYAVAHGIEDAKAMLDRTVKAAMAGKSAADLWAAWQALDRTIAAGPYDAASQQMSAEQADLERQIAETPAESVRDLEAKVGLARSFLTAGDPDDDRGVRLLDGMAADLRRLLA